MDVDAVASWYEAERGITRDTLKAFKVTTEAGNVTFVYPNGVKQRPDPTTPLREDQRRFYFTKGRQPLLFQHPTPATSETAFLVEGESDCMRLWQELGDRYPVYGLGGINCWNEGTAARLAEYKKVYVVLDNDEREYGATDPVDLAWRKIRHDLGAHAKRVFLPKSCKDICEFFMDGYDIESFHGLCQRSATSLYSPIDFTVPPPPVRWLVDGMLAMGDVTVLSGLGGLGKSWITMALSLAMLRGEESFLGRRLEQHGKILYVDEENPLDVVHDRLRKMGLEPGRHAGHLRYLWNQHIRLDKNPDRLLDEALAFGPDLLVVDSLTRVHSLAEDEVGQMGPLMNDGITPLARETGAAVIVIHHHDKAGKGARGSGDIVNSADMAYDLHAVGVQEKMKMTYAKPRRKRSFDELFISIDDQADGTIKLNVVDPIQLSF